MSGDQSRALAEEQAALRRVATLVAGGAVPEKVFGAVTEEVGQLLPVDFADLSRYEPDGTITILATWGITNEFLPAGARVKLGGKNLSTVVAETRASARIESYADASGPIGDAVRDAGARSVVGTPIIVDGRLWGMVAAGSTIDKPLPADAEARLASFTELLATAVLNAEGRGALARIAAEQAALRRVATLVARGLPQEQLFAAVTSEIGGLLPVEYSYLVRYELDRTGAIVGAWGMAGGHVPVGSRQALRGKNLVTLVLKTARSARVDDFADASGPFGDDARERGVRSAVGTPILVEGRLWGVVIVGSREEQPLPADTEERLASFTELVATAIANAESRAGLTRLAEQQAALLRVATLVAAGSPQGDLFSAVVGEIGQLLAVEYSYMGRYESGGTAAVIATWGEADEWLPVGTRATLGGNNLATILRETGRSARIDDYADSSSGSLGDVVRESGVRSGVASPIMVEGQLWGLISIGSIRTRSLPADTEARLGSFTELVATAIANVESRAELAASRARIVAASDESRRRIERNLHDGAQQRLVHAVIVLKLALRALSNGEANAGELVAEALRHAEQAHDELRELANGILPAALTRGGLKAGVEALVSRASLPVSMDVSVGRLSDTIEATAYFVISEALTNVIKHARATSAQVTARVERGELRVEVRDDGVGGATGGHGTGLGGLEDRITALNGRLVLESPLGGGTCVCARVPITPGPVRPDVLASVVNRGLR